MYPYLQWMLEIFHNTEKIIISLHPTIKLKKWTVKLQTTYSWWSFREWGIGICSLELSFWAFLLRWIQMQVMAKAWVDWGLLMSGTGIN